MTTHIGKSKIVFPLAQKRKVFSISAQFATDCYNNSMVIVQSGCSRLYTLQPSKSVPLSHLTHLSASETRHEEAALALRRSPLAAPGSQLP